MADFLTAFNYMIANEDYSPSDSRYGKTDTDNDGGKVRFGLNSNSFPALLNTDYYTTDVQTAFQTAKDIYSKNQWRQIHGDDIQSNNVAAKVFDMAVNMGSVQAAKLTQRAAGVNVDGVIGSITIRAINDIDENTMLASLVQWWNWFIDREIENKPQDEAYRTNWENRAKKIPV